MKLAILILLAVAIFAGNVLAGDLTHGRGGKLVASGSGLGPVLFLTEFPCLTN